MAKKKSSNPLDNPPGNTPATPATKKKAGRTPLGVSASGGGSSPNAYFAVPGQPENPMYLNLGHGPVLATGSVNDPVKARYFANDEYNPSGYGTDQIVALQNGLRAAHFLTGKFTAGVWDPASVSAYKRALTSANQQGISVYDVIGLAAQGGTVVGGSGGGGGGGGGLGAPPPNRDDVNAMFNKTAQQELGRSLNEDELNRAYDAFIGNASDPGGSTPTTFADTWLRGQQGPVGGVEAVAHDASNVYGVFDKLLNGVV